jgi:hypothetical protein
LYGSGDPYNSFKLPGWPEGTPGRTGIVDSMGTDSIGDSTLISFYQNYDTLNIGNFQRLYDSIAVQLDSTTMADSALFYTAINNLQVKNNSFKPAITAETNEQLINNFTLNYLLTDTVNADDSSFIYTMAFSCAYSNGPAVYTARSYYRAIYHDDTTQFNDDTICAYAHGHRMMRIHANTDTTATINKQIAVFPNPAADKVNIVTSLSLNETGVIDLYNIEGVKMKEIQVTGGTITSILQIDNLADGVYLYYLHTNQQYYARGKLVIAK